MNTRFRKTLAAFGMALVFGFTGQASGSSMELALVLDGSGSISSTNWQIQLNGYKNAFTSGSFYDDYVAPSPFDSLWVSVFQFSNNVVQEVDWTEITSNASATAFGNLFNTTEMPRLAANTNTSGALATAMNSILSNNISGSKLTIDISTDGQPNLCKNASNPSAAGHSGGGCNAPAEAISVANSARGAGITVNALGVGSSINGSFLQALVGIAPASTPTGFYLLANTFDDFGSTIQTKLGREITTPEPSLVLLIGGGLAAMGFARRKRAS
ncbi:MAG: DUF1194 domain-containing protein [Gammaproteobacteria bacterium]|nr:DUF1194 domain-containing protein [Gammaproteobacteria bacterium]